VAGVVHAGHGEHDVRDGGAVVHHGEPRAVAADLEAPHRPAGGAVVPDRDGAGPLRQRGPGGIVGADETDARRVRDEALEGADERVEAAPVVEAVGLEVGDEDVAGAEFDERPVALVRLDDEGRRRVPGVPNCTPAHLVQVAADEERGVGAGLDEDERQQRGRRRLAVGPGDRHRRPLAADLLEQLGAAQDGDTALACGLDLGVGPRDRRGDGDGVDVTDVGLPVADVDLDADALEAPQRGRVLQVRTGDPFAHGGEDRGDGAHARATGAHHVHGVEVLERHAAWASRSSAMRSAASRWPARAAAAAMASRAAGEAMRGASSAARRSPVQSGSGTTRQAPAAASRRAPTPWWSCGAIGSGTRTDGTPTAVSSATVTPPARPTHTSAADRRVGTRSSYSTAWYWSLSGAGRRGPSAVQSRAPSAWWTATSSRSDQRSTRSNTASLMRRAPREPPVTATRWRPGSIPSSVRALRRASGSRDTRRTSSRTGVPVSTDLGRPVPSNATALAFAHRAASRLAAPGTALASATTRGTRSTSAATAHGQAA